MSTNHSRKQDTDGGSHETCGVLEMWVLRYSPFWKTRSVGVDTQTPFHRSLAMRALPNAVLPFPLTWWHCNPDGAEIPFDNILDRVTGSDPSVTDYILESPAKCPNCWRNILEKTLVEPTE